MNEVRAPLAPGREVSPESLADITTARVNVEIVDGGEVVITSAEPLPANEAAAIRHRLMSRSDHEEQLRLAADDYLHNPEPDLATVRAQVKRLTEIVLGEPEG